MSKYNNISIDWENIVKKTASKEIENNDEIVYKPSIEELAYNMFIDNYESDIIDLFLA